MLKNFSKSGVNLDYLHYIKVFSTVVVFFLGGYRYVLLWVAVFMTQYRPRVANLCSDSNREDILALYDGAITCFELYCYINLLVEFFQTWDWLQF